MSLFKFLNRRQCPHTMAVKENHVVVREVRCTLDVDHKGFHVNGGHNWMSSDRLHRFMEEHGRGL